MSDFHLRVLQGAARSARDRLALHRATPPKDDGAQIDHQLEEASTADDAQVAQSLERRRRPAATEHSIAELDALANHARNKLALYRRRLYTGRGTQTKLAELERISLYAAARAKRARRGGGPSAGPNGTS